MLGIKVGHERHECTGSDLWVADWLGAAMSLCV